MPQTLFEKIWGGAGQPRTEVERPGFLTTNGVSLSRLAYFSAARIEETPIEMNDTIKLLDVVALTVDLPEYKLWRGQVGTVVEILPGSAAYEVEFSDRDGRTYESIGLRPDQIMVLRYEPLNADSRPVAEPAR